MTVRIVNGPVYLIAASVIKVWRWPDLYLVSAENIMYVRHGDLFGSDSPVEIRNIKVRPVPIKDRIHVLTPNSRVILALNGPVG